MLFANLFSRMPAIIYLLSKQQEKCQAKCNNEECKREKELQEGLGHVDEHHHKDAITWKLLDE